jgi:phosphohistidine phosphatase SixA
MRAIIMDEHVRRARELQMKRQRQLITAFAFTGFAVGVLHAQALEGSALVESLRDGGYVIAMRHASSPRSAPDPATTHPDNVNGERQLDEVGRQSAADMGQALRQLDIPVGEILSSPTFRAVQTARLLDLGEPETHTELDSRERDSEWLASRLATVSQETNTIIVTHAPNLADAFGDEAAGMTDGEALILRPGSDGTEVVGRVGIDEWRRMH